MNYRKQVNLKLKAIQARIEWMQERENHALTSFDILSSFKRETLTLLNIFLITIKDYEPYIGMRWGNYHCDNYLMTNQLEKLNTALDDIMEEYKIDINEKDVDNMCIISNEDE